MDDLISRTAAKSEIIKYAKFLWDEYKEPCNLAGMLDAIDKTPSEQKHGKWLTTPYTDYDDAWECSSCGELWTFNGGTPMDIGANFCPNCGARMECDAVSPCDGCEKRNGNGCSYCERMDGEQWMK